MSTSPFENRAQVWSFLTFLGALELLVFSASFSEYFQGDALFWLQHRFTSWTEFANSLTQLDVANWYRPLSNRTIPSLFFPWFGLDPYGYHWIVFALFFLSTCANFWFLRMLTASFNAAMIGTLFFSIHSIHVYVTYDFAFAPELLYATFYLLACGAYYRGSVSTRWYAASLFFFVLALMSKESAVTLPATLALMTLLVTMPATHRWKRLVPHAAILAIYLAYVVVYLNVGAGDYAVSFHDDILSRLGTAFLWAFNYQPGLTPEGFGIPILISAAVVAAYAATSLAGPRRNLTLLGIGWFVVALAPMLGIVGAFGPYYLFLPLTGIALLSGLAYEWLYHALPFSRATATLLVAFLLLPFVISARVNAQKELRVNSALGYAGRIARQSAGDLKGAHPTIPDGVTLLILNDDEPNLWRYYGLDALIRLTYPQQDVDVRYSSLGHTVPDDVRRGGNFIVMRFESGGLADVTAKYRENPGAVASWQTEKDFEYVTSDRMRLEVEPGQVKLGKDFYKVRIVGLGNTDAELQYRFNDGPVTFLRVRLDTNGETSFFVSEKTKLGVYRFTGFRAPPETRWIRASASVTVLD